MNAIVHKNFDEIIDYSNIPSHVAIIMDGNGRWARKINKERFFGHNRGVNSVKESIDVSIELGIKTLTLFAFSMENWRRPKNEINALMTLLSSSIENELKSMTENNIKLNVIGDLDMVPKKIRDKLLNAIIKTKNNDGLNLNLAVSYGAKQELIRAIKIICNKVKKNIISEENIDEETINEHLYTRNSKNVDLLIRTGGEFRVSNFLLWQISYAELNFQKVLWPDFKKYHFLNAIIDYQNRTRRFGKIHA
ncbi:MAG: di-trans,poly-cis-decaprenylcistransferase [Flavobacteriaceae bacterium]|nr:di-trans,poly-cis-decaprenylcistransferase [Flavobacteriaceae bacterium]|tara:strand:+ start:994 stop:1743 length:750 start_codon:yes stop_codon:yes gene_type:complete